MRNSEAQLFQIYTDTTFDDLLAAACYHWKFNKLCYELTDEYYNNLSAFNQPAIEFFDCRIYTPLNTKGIAEVFLIQR